jgi:hypothetical protein
MMALFEIVFILAIIAWLVVDNLEEIREWLILKSLEGIGKHPMKKLGSLGFQWWGYMRPAKVTFSDGSAYIPLFWGLWKRVKK